MKRLHLSLIVLLLVVCNGYGQSTSNKSPFVPVEINGKWGFIDQSGVIAIKPNYDLAENFSDGWAKVKAGDKVFFIDANGKTVLTPAVSSVKSFSEGLAAATKADSKKWGYINKKGAFVIKPRFLLAYDFSEGKAAVKVKKKAGFGYINTQGKTVIKPQFDGARKFVDGLAPAQTGGFVFGRWGYINASGSFVIKQQYDDALPFSDGLAAVDTKKSGSAKENTWGYINKKGTMVIKSQFEYGRSFSGGLAPVKYPSGWEFVDTEGKYVFNRLGNKLIKFADPFQGNLARATTKAYESIGSRGGTVTYQGNAKKWAYVDKTGKKVWPKAKVVASPKLEDVPDGYNVFNADWADLYVTMAYPQDWAASDLYKKTGFIKGVSFVKNGQVSDKLFSSKKVTIDNLKKIRLVSNDNIIINVGVHPGGGTDFTPKYFLQLMTKSAVKNPKKEPIKTYEMSNDPVALRKISGMDAEGQNITAFQFAIKKQGHMINMFAYMPVGSEKSTQKIISTMLNHMKVVDK